MMHLDFITNLWPTAQRAAASLPPASLPVPTLDDPWTRAGKLPTKPRKASGKRSATTRQSPPPIDGDDAVLLALITACRAGGRSWMTFSISELADLMTCSVGESSKRVKIASDGERLVWAQKMGRRKMVGLHKIAAADWAEISNAKPMVAVNLYRACIHRVKVVERRQGVIHNPT